MIAEYLFDAPDDVSIWQHDTCGFSADAFVCEVSAAGGLCRHTLCSEMTSRIVTSEIEYSCSLDHLCEAGAEHIGYRCHHSTASRDLFSFSRSCQPAWRSSRRLLLRVPIFGCDTSGLRRLGRYLDCAEEDPDMLLSARVLDLACTVTYMRTSEATRRTESTARTLHATLVAEALNRCLPRCAALRSLRVHAHFLGLESAFSLVGQRDTGICDQLRSWYLVGLSPVVHTLPTRESRYDDESDGLDQSAKKDDAVAVLGGCQSYRDEDCRQRLALDCVFRFASQMRELYDEPCVDSLDLKDALRRVDLTKAPWRECFASVGEIERFVAADLDSSSDDFECDTIKPGSERDILAELEGIVDSQRYGRMPEDFDRHYEFQRFDKAFVLDTLTNHRLAQSVVPNLMTTLSYDIPDCNGQADELLLAVLLTPCFANLLHLRRQPWPSELKPHELLAARRCVSRGPRMLPLIARKPVQRTLGCDPDGNIALGPPVRTPSRYLAPATPATTCLIELDLELELDDFDKEPLVRPLGVNELSTYPAFYGPELISLTDT